MTFQTNSVANSYRSDGFRLFRPLAAVLAAAVITAMPVYGYLVSFAFAAVLAVAMGLLLLILAPAAVPVVLVFSVLFQNLFVATASPHIESANDFLLIRSPSFIVMCTVWSGCAVLYLTRRYGPIVDKYVIASSAVLAVITLYLAYGLPANGNNALVYFRNAATPLLLFQIGLVLGWRQRESWIAGLSLTGLALLLYGYCELFFGLQFLSLFNADHYLEIGLRDFLNSGFWINVMRETGFVLREITDPLKIDPFNIPYLKGLWGKTVRPHGPNLHAISYAYALVFFAMLAAWRGKFYYAAIAAPILVMIGSKGAVAAFGFGLAALLVTRLFGPRRWLFWTGVLALVAYTGAAIAVALSINDYHVLGFLAGVKSFLNNPLGHGLGSGGNLSLNASKIDWSKAQHLGGTGAAVESAIGVLLYQVGVAALLIAGFYVWLGSKLWHTYLNCRLPVLGMACFGIVVLTANAVLQEEALFAPLAAGIMMLMAGLGMGQAAKLASAPDENSGQLARHVER